MIPESTNFIESPALSIGGIRAGIKGIIGRKIFFYEIIDSTNAAAAAFAREAEEEGVVVIADSQSKGRGRLGRSWLSPPSVNIYMSILLKPEMTAKDATLITIMAAVGCTIALRKVTGLDITIKWPNDLMSSEKKLGGILTETRVVRKRIEYAITGIGVNVNMDADALPDIMKGVATSIKMETGKFFSRTDIIREVVNEMDDWYNILREKRYSELLSQWKHLTSTLGRNVQVVLGKETLQGQAESINDEGMLVLRLPSGASRVVQYGDLTVIR
jgi:BirA family biotin operon repressor/biotin-[acetyl-CoA-carboxylase] ligase